MASAYNLKYCKCGKGGDWKALTGMGGRWRPYAQSGKASMLFSLRLSGGWEGYSCDFWVYNETGAQQDGKRNRKRSWLLSLRISNVLLPRGWVTGYVRWQLVSPNDQLATSSPGGTSVLRWAAADFGLEFLTAVCNLAEDKERTQAYIGDLQAS